MPSNQPPPISQQGGLARDRFGNLSRRDFIRFNLALLALAGTSSCHWPDDPPDERTAFRLLRAEDLLSLKFELRNLRIQNRWRKPARLVRIREQEEALLIVGFPGQHIFEQAYPENGREAGSPALPARARIARPSRLVFKLPPERRYIDLTFDGLLRWGDWNSVWQEADRKGQTPSTAVEPSLVAMPYGLALSPEDATRWHHATHPVTHDDRTELWHTRLLPKGSRQPLTVKILQPEPLAHDMTNITTALMRDDREVLAGRKAQARTLILSPMGGWLDVRGRWQSESPIAPWQQRITAGQDQQVVIEREDGFLYPFGQRATLISVTERKLVKVPENASPEALLRQRNFIVIKQPEVEYSHGKMALSRITALDLVTPPLYNARRCNSDNCFFWIETGPGEAFPFRFRACDWAERPLFLEAPAIFVAKKAQPSDAKALYEKEDNDPRRITPLHGQPAAVVIFDSAVEGDTDRWGVPLENPRSVGDTTLYMLQIEFAGADRTDQAAGAPPFDCRTKRMEVRLPSLEPYLDDAANRGWFTLVDPDPENNLGEVFARAWDGAKIPMYFDRQTDRSGGVAAPSFDVDGLSRVRGPVGDARPGGPMYENGRFDTDTYFNDEHANLLGSFPLSQLLLTDDGTRSPAVPAIHFSLSPKPLPKDAAKNARPQWEAGLGLSWRIALKEFTFGPAYFVPDRDAKDRSKARLDIAARLTKTLGKPPVPEGQPPDADRDEAGGAADPARKEKRSDEPALSSVSWQVSGKISNFAIALDTGPLGDISIGFAHLGVTLGPPPPEKNKKPDPKSQKKDEEQTAEKKKLATKIDYQLSEIKAEGVLSFLVKFIQMVADLPRIPDIDVGAPPSASPSQLADVGDADINVKVGPMALPTPSWKWLGKFEVTNLAVSLGVGLYILPRQIKDSEPPRVPDNLFTIRIASADKPLTLMAEPWGGLAHVGFNFTPRGMTGFQCGLGIVYRAQFNLSGAKAKCEGSLTGVFTYQIKGDGSPSHQVALVLKLDGQAVIAGFIDIHLTLMAAGIWDIDANRWFFSVEITVRIKISFFAVRARFRFSYELSSGGGGLMAKTALPDADRLTENEWLAYRAAFAEEAF